MHRQRVLVSFLVLCLLPLLSPFVGAFSGPPEVGRPAPDFTLISDEGSQVSLKHYRGKWVVLYFYPKDFTSGCTIEARNFQRDLAKYQKANAVIIGISTDDVESHKNFCSKEGLGFRLLADTDSKVSEMYGSIMEYNEKKYSARNTFIINPEGKVARVFLAVKPMTHSEEVLESLAELQKK
ncbi:MAG TPA: peroxiredoxin [Blastocatellia bacterium]|nr:peroxiredoxin [Blastocatellia bacterium]